MTSSWALTKRKEMGNTWVFGDHNDPLGGWEDHYIIPGHTRECHPDYVANPIGNPYGFMVCVKRKGFKGKYLDQPQCSINKDLPDLNGYNRFSADLYRPWRQTQIQMYDPYNYYDRTAPNEEFLHNNDYLAREMNFNANGIDPVHTPGDRKYYEYGLSYSHNPPSKYDITRLHQAYPVWKDNKIYHASNKLDEQEKLDKLDQKL